MTDHPAITGRIVDAFIVCRTEDGLSCVIVPQDSTFTVEIDIADGLISGSAHISRIAYTTPHMAAVFAADDAGLPKALDDARDLIGGMNAVSVIDQAALDRLKAVLSGT